LFGTVYLTSVDKPSNLLSLLHEVLQSDLETEES